MKAYKIELIKRVVTTKEGKSFDTFKAVQKDGKLIDVHFKKTCKMPTESGFATIESDKLQLNKTKKFPELWISEIKEFEPKSHTLNNDLDAIF